MKVATIVARCLTVAAALALIACVTEVRVAGPEPVAVPPPPAQVDTPPPDADAEMQASEAPPPLPVYEQPPCPGDGWLWTPGYWAYGPGGYYWVPGTWVMPPRVGLLWTPGYWAFFGGAYVFRAGYWGPHVGFYGGINYGFGYIGAGYVGGRWNGGAFVYNRAVTNVNVTVVHNTYNETVVNQVVINRVSYNGGAGVAAQPTAQERMASQEPHVPPTVLQHQHVQEAARNPALFARANGGRPPVAATARPAVIPPVGVHPMAPMAQHSNVAAAADAHDTRSPVYQPRPQAATGSHAGTAPKPQASVAKAKRPAHKAAPKEPHERQ